MTEPDDGDGASRRPGWPAVAGGVALLLVVIGVVVAFQFDSVNDLLHPEALARFAAPWRGSALAGAITIVAFALISALGVPVTLLILVTTLAFDIWLGAAYSYVGLMLGATLDYWGGRTLGQATVRRLVGERLDKVARNVRRANIVTLALVRFVPVAPFAVINLAAGATGVRQHAYLISTAIASIPGVLGVALVGDRLSQVLTSPTPASVAVLVGVVVAVGGVAYLLQWLIGRLRRRRRTG